MTGSAADSKEPHDRAQPRLVMVRSCGTRTVKARRPPGRSTRYASLQPHDYRLTIFGNHRHPDSGNKPPGTFPKMAKGQHGPASGNARLDSFGQHSNADASNKSSGSRKGQLSPDRLRQWLWGSRKEELRAAEVQHAEVAHHRVEQTPCRQQPQSVFATCRAEHS